MTHFLSIENIPKNILYLFIYLMFFQFCVLGYLASTIIMMSEGYRFEIDSD